MEATTMAGAIAELQGRGFTAHFTLKLGRLRVGGSATSFGAEQVTVADWRRFEGVSDPDDMEILYAIETRTGVRGTLADAFGVYSDPAVGAFMQDVPQKRGDR